MSNMMAFELLVISIYVIIKAVQYAGIAIEKIMEVYRTKKSIDRV